ncbi:hypothetical protein OIU84_023327 [Salix udensis]|uniref:Uncharacterized protein n=1 Tax=Salix udensis TaxID=889485 RepID=A0AAD6PFN9_9ROSI|nr:hypothetical protein OIU84_023327 [Salix udensis]
MSVLLFGAGDVRKYLLLLMELYVISFDDSYPPRSLRP